MIKFMHTGIAPIVFVNKFLAQVPVYRAYEYNII